METIYLSSTKRSQTSQCQKLGADDFIHFERYPIYFLVQHLEQWPKHLPLVCHAEGRTTAAILLLAELADRPVHIAHVARREEVRSIFHVLK